MEVSAMDMSGAIASASAALSGPKQMADSSRQATSRDSKPVSHAELKQMVEQMQLHLDSMNVSLQYSFYGAGSEKVAVQVVNRETGQVIREIPSREMQVLQTKMSELVGMIFNDNA